MNQPMFDCTAQLYKQSKTNSKIVSPLGSCVFLQDEEGFYLVTAKHVLNDARNSNFFVFVTSGAMIFIEGDCRFSQKEGYDNIDIAICRLSKAIVDVLLQRYKFLPVSQMVTRHSPSEKFAYIVAGFPAKQTVKRQDKFDVTPFSFISSIIKLNNKKPQELKEEDNIFIRYSRRNQGFVNDKFSSAGINDLRGISGGGLWLIDLSTSDTEPKTLYLVAIIIEADIKNGYICATKAAYVESILRNFISSTA